MSAGREFQVVMRWMEQQHNNVTGQFGVYAVWGSPMSTVCDTDDAHTHLGYVTVTDKLTLQATQCLCAWPWRCQHCRTSSYCSVLFSHPPEHYTYIASPTRYCSFILSAVGEMRNACVNRRGMPAMSALAASHIQSYITQRCNYKLFRGTPKRDAA